MLDYNAITYNARRRLNEQHNTYTCMLCFVACGRARAAVRERECAEEGNSCNTDSNTTVLPNPIRCATPALIKQQPIMRA